MRFRIHSNFGTTGGHQSAHQICAGLEAYCQDTCMVYPPVGNTSVVPLWQQIYSLNKFVARADLDDEPDSIHVLPAGWGPNWYPMGPNINSCIKAKGPDPYKSRKVMWWLGLTKWQDWDIGGFDADINLDHHNIPLLWHGCQSQAAYDFLMASGKVARDRVFMLRDYTHDFWLHSELELYKTLLQREDIILYNPVKGIEITKAVMQLLPEVSWVPLTGMSREQIRELALRSKVYIDFGHHPGRDRIPREMAVCGLSVIVGSDGTAGNDIDVPLYKRKFRRSAGQYDVRAIADQISYDLNHHEEAFFEHDLVQYRWVVRNEKRAVMDDIGKMIGMFIS